MLPAKVLIAGRFPRVLEHRRTEPDPDTISAPAADCLRSAAQLMVVVIGGSAAIDELNGFLLLGLLAFLVILSLAAMTQRVRRKASVSLKAHTWKWPATGDLAVEHSDDEQTGGEYPTVIAARIELVLTARELDVLRLVALGERNHEIGRNLCIEETTVRYHLRNVFAKLSARSRTEAVRRAREIGCLT